MSEHREEEEDKTITCKSFCLPNRKSSPQHLTEDEQYYCRTPSASDMAPVGHTSWYYPSPGSVTLPESALQSPFYPCDRNNFSFSSYSRYDCTKRPTGIGERDREYFPLQNEGYVMEGFPSRVDQNDWVSPRLIPPSAERSLEPVNSEKRPTGDENKVTG